jgi:hypothetical protein
MKKASIFFSIFFCVAIVLFSCKKEADSAYWNSQFFGPLVKASLGIDNLLPDSILQANPDSSLKIVYETDVFKINIDTLFKIPDTSIRQAFNIPIAVTFNPGQMVVNNNTSETTYALPSVQLRTTTVKSGSVHYRIKSYINEETNFIYSIPSAKLNGNAFLINVVVPAAVGDVPGIYDATYDLSNYVIDLTGIYHNKVNTLYTTFSASVSASGSPVLVNNTDSIIIENTFNDLIPYYAKGYFGQNTFNIGPETTDFDIFKRIVDGTIQLEDVNFNFKIKNPIGLDARIYINNLSSINTRTNTTINLSNSIVGSPININRASESGGTVYPYNVTFPLTTTNSNIKPMLENLPDKFGYDIEIIANPLGNVSGSNDFIYSDNLLNASLNMEIPLSLVATNLTLVDTIDVNISGGEVENVNSATFTLFADNGFPFDATLQMYLLNETNGITDSIFSTINNIDEAPVNSNLRVTSKRLTKLSVPIAESKLDLLLNTKKMLMKVKFNTAAQPQYIKIYSDYSIDVKLVGDVNYSIHVN